MRKLIPFWIILAVALVLVVPGVSAQGMEANMLVWEFIQGQQDGHLDRLTSAGEQEVLINFPDGIFDNQAKQCSQRYWAAGGDAVAVFTGATSGEIAIYPLGGGERTLLGSAHRMSCAGPRSFQLSPNGQRAGYINYEFDVLDRPYPVGDLVLFEAATGTQLASFDWTSGFALYDDGALAVRLFPDGEGNATEADIDWWDGAGRRTLTTLEPVYPPDVEDPECTISTAEPVRLGDTAYVLFGQRCDVGGSNWRLVSLPMAGGAATEIAFGEPGGGFFTGSFATQLLPTQDGAGFLMAVPSGLDRNTMRLAWVTTAGGITPVLEGQHIIADRYGERLTEGRHMMVTIDGSAVAFVAVNANGDQSLYVLDLSTFGGEPALVEEGGSGERIFQYVWAANNQLYFASGSIESSALSVASVDGSSQRLARGRFYRVATSYNGDKIAASEWIDNPERLGDDLFKLTLMNASGSAMDFRVGGQEHNQFIPLAVQ